MSFNALRCTKATWKVPTGNKYVGGFKFCWYHKPLAAEIGQCIYPALVCGTALPYQSFQGWRQEPEGEEGLAVRSGLWCDPSLYSIYHHIPQLQNVRTSTE